MDETSFIARQLRDWAFHATKFQPFAVTLSSGESVIVDNPRLLSLLSGGIYLVDKHEGQWVIPYGQIASLATLFTPDLEV